MCDFLCFCVFLTMERDLDLLDNANRDIRYLEIHRPRRYLRDMDNPMETFNNVDFKKRFRFHKEVVRDILLPIVIEEQITNRGLPISPLLALLITLRFFATGSFQLVCGDLRGFHQSTVSRVIKKMSRRIASQSRNFIKFPVNQQETMRQFREIANFPNVMGCIDCTHIPIINPGGPFAELFRNRKRVFSINVQVVGGPNLEIYDIVSRYPGSYHDSYIFNRSSVKGKFMRRELPGYLLGDAGYPCLPYLLTPFREPHTPAETRYNRVHITTRNTVERLFGVLKRRFPCLSRRLHNNLDNSAYIIVACAVLHNIAITQREDVEESEQVNDNNIQENPVPIGNDGLGNLTRRNIVNNYFN